MTSISEIRRSIIEKRPLILNVTNFVTPDFIANGLLSLGASPIMSQSSEEMEELIQMASAVVINIGTLNEEWMQLARSATHIANIMNKPIILDPVGAGATHLRTSFAQELLSTRKIDIIRGNASEIMALANQGSHTKGVDSTLNTEMAIDAAQFLAQNYHLVTAMSGVVDIILDRNRIQKLAYGSPMMCSITGTGCLLSSVVASFRAVHSDSFEAAWSASFFYAVCGEQAAAQSALPGSFKMHFIDALHQSNFEMRP